MLSPLPEQTWSHLFRVNYDVPEIRARLRAGTHHSIPSLLEVIACQRDFDQSGEATELNNRVEDYMQREGFAQLLMIKLEERDSFKHGGPQYLKFATYLWTMDDFVTGPRRWREAICDVWMRMSNDDWEDLRSGKDVDVAAIFAKVLKVPIEEVDADAVRKFRILVAGGPASRRLPI